MRIIMHTNVQTMSRKVDTIRDILPTAKTSRISTKSHDIIPRELTEKLTKTKNA